MARPRYLLEGDYHHVYFCGVDGTPVFRDAHDRRTFLRYWSETPESPEVLQLAWALLSTHGHYFLGAPIDLISKHLHRVLGRYARWFNCRWGRSGDLFQGRFKSIPVRNSEYARTLVRYILLNPVGAGLCSLTGLVDYPWTNFRTLSSNKGFPNGPAEEQLLSLFAVKPERFISELMSWLGAATKQGSAKEVLYEACVRHHVTGSEVRGRSKKPGAVAARAEVAWRLASEFEWAHPNIARYLRCSCSSVHRFTLRKRRSP